MNRVQPYKGYGQHFLKDSSVVSKTLELIRKYHTGDRIIEIGPGTGALTGSLLQQFSHQLMCIEIDERCVAFLKEKWPTLKDKIISEDFLKADLRSVLTDNTSLVGNFPYNISSQIIFRMLEYRDHIPLLVGMFQKEVAVRIAAPHGNKEYGILSVLTQIYYDAEVAFHIPPGAFQPPPKVMSSVLVLRRKQSVETFDFKMLSRIVKAAFNQRRKMLRNALSGIFPKEILEEPLFEKRAEQLSVETFVELSRRLGNYNQEDCKG